MALVGTNQAVSEGNFVTSVHLHSVPLNLCYCSPKQHMISAWLLTKLPLSEACCHGSHYGCYCQELVPWHPRQREFKKPLCAFTLVAHVSLLKIAVLMQVMVPSGSVIL